jgi:hypothetical protein
MQNIEKEKEKEAVYTSQQVLYVGLLIRSKPRANVVLPESNGPCRKIIKGNVHNRDNCVASASASFSDEQQLSDKVGVFIRPR